MPVESAATRPLPPWQPDENVQACPLCETKFTWYYRKHHCRACGRVICNACCSNFYSLRSERIVRPPELESPSFLTTLQGLAEDDSASGTEEVRTCDACFSRLEQDRCRRMLGLDISTLDPRVAAQLIRDSNASPSLLASPPPSYTQTSVSAERLSTSIPGTEGARHRRQHDHDSIGGSHGHRHPRRRRSTQDGAHASSSAPISRLVPTLPPSPRPEPVVPLRYVAFELNEQDKMLGEECPICFEEYESGQSIARLECWCVFHLRCIKAWKSQKAGAGGCPLHFHD